MKHFSNQDEDIYVLKDMGRVVGAAMARYSRSQDGLRDVIRNEFMKDGVLQNDAADSLIERVLIAFGDDSVGELENAHVCVENISMLATKAIEHRRIGLSPIEKSSRYVTFGKKSGRYPFYTPPSLEGYVRDEYVRTMNEIFDNYMSMIRSMKKYLKRISPLGDFSTKVNGVDLTFESTGDDRKAFKRIYNQTIKTKACDVVRAFLPLSTQTNVGISGNGRSFQHVITHLQSTNQEEFRNIGVRLKEELSKSIPHYVKRGGPSKYMMDNTTSMQILANRLFGGFSSENDEVTLLPKYDEMTSLAVQCVYPYTKWSQRALYDALLENQNWVKTIIETYVGSRETRRDRPGRGFESGYPYNFDLVTEWAVYKDLMRHRMGTIQAQAPTTKLGFQMPPEIDDADLSDIANRTIALADNLYDLLMENAHEDAGYAVLHGHKIRWSIGMNARALMHMLELRSAPQGHVNYRRVSQKMFHQLYQREPLVAYTFKFVNLDDHFWARADSEARQEEKRRQKGFT